MRKLLFALMKWNCTPSSKRFCNDKWTTNQFCEDVKKICELCRKILHTSISKNCIRDDLNIAIPQIPFQSMILCTTTQDIIPDIVDIKVYSVECLLQILNMYIGTINADETSVKRIINGCILIDKITNINVAAQTIIMSAINIETTIKPMIQTPSIIPGCTETETETETEVDFDSLKLLTKSGIEGMFEELRLISSELMHFN